MRRFGENITVPPPRYVRKHLFMCHIWSRRSKYTPAASRDCVVPRTVRQKEAVEEKSARIKSRPVLELGVMNCRSVDNKLDYIFDHCNDNKLDIVALTETWISNDPSKSNRVVIECAERGYTLRQILRSSGRKGGGVSTISNTRATFAYYSFCDNLRLQCTLRLLSLFAVIFKLILSEKK